MGHTTAVIAVDAAVFSLRDGRLHVLVRRREKEPFKGRGELIGGLLRDDEDAEGTMRRKIAEVTAKDMHVEQFHTFSQPGRDPRARTVSIGFVALTAGDGIEAGDWRERPTGLAFDHDEILAHARTHLKDNAMRLSRHLLPEEFPLNRLQIVIEQLTGETQDNRNFRKRMLAAGLVEETGSVERGVSHRPGRLYRFVE